METTKKRGRAWGLALTALLALAICGYAFALYATPERASQQPFVSAKGELPGLWLYMLWAHAVTAGTALAIGWLQFIGKLRRSRPVLHRAVGYVYAAGIAVAGVTGLYLACYGNGGWSGRIGFATLAALWLYTLYRSLRSIIVERKPREHGEWMLRNYALTFAAITLRIYVPLAAVLFGVTDTNDSFIVIAWLAWVPNLAFAQWWISRSRKKIQRRPAGRSAASSKAG
ncbi:DUF2306 domain-containing protein [Paenibacillus athensensis]|uniref:DUF2306 domain-containing protein n=1 Tax=Paenibacillus athensensis TaxID=1967502 RepID=A0A4Y8Q9T1_9BACL|nr:DUF2306 domain-containing protein [Paenibacillus athensensis]MCD1259999.1 DUF2306 domain-containing protein [Paenibacillus athensensis]